MVLKIGTIFSITVIVIGYNTEVHPPDIATDRPSWGEEPVKMTDPRFSAYNKGRSGGGYSPRDRK